MPEEPKRRSWLVRVARGLGIVLASVLGAALCLLLSLTYHLTLVPAREALRETVNALVSDLIKGELDIGAIDELSATRVVVRDVVVRDEDGLEVIRAERVTAIPDLGALLRGEIRIASARLEHGEVTLRVAGPDALEVSLIRAFMPAQPGGPDDGSEPVRVVIDGISLYDVDVHGDAPHYPGIVVDDLAARGRIEIAGGFALSVYEGSGRMRGPYPGVTEIERVVLELAPDWEQGLDVYVEAHRDDDRVRARTRITRPDDREPPHLVVTAALEPLSAATLTDMGFPGVEVLAGSARGHARLEGPADDLRLDATLETDAGPVHVRGELAVDRDFVFEGETSGLDLAELVPAAPPMRIAGEARVSVVRDPDSSTRAVVRVRAEPLEVAGLVVPGFEAEGALTDDALLLERVEAPHLGGEVRASGRVGYDGSLDLAAHVAVEDIGADPNVREALPGAHGGIDADLSITAGPLADDLTLDGRVVLTGFRYGPLRARRLVARGRVRGIPDRAAGAADIDATDLVVSGVSLGDVSAEGSGGPDEWVVRARAQRGRVVRSGAVEARIVRRAGGIDVHAPQLSLDLGTGEYRGHLDVLSVRGGRTELSGLELRGEHDQSLVSVDPLALEGATPESRAEWSMVSGDGSRVGLRFAIDLAEVAPLLPERFARLGGRAEGVLAIEGDLGSPHIELRGAVPTVTLDSVRDAHFDEVALVHDDGITRVRVHGELGAQGGLTLQGAIHAPLEALVDTARIGHEARLEDFEIWGDEINLAFLVPLLGDSARELGVSGRISVDAPVEGTLDDLRIAHAVVILDRFGLPDWSPVRVKAQLSYADERLGIERLWIADGAGELAMGEASLHLSLADPPADLPSLLRTIASDAWTLSLRLAPRETGTWPRPLAKRMPQGVRLSGTVLARGGDGETTLDADVSAEWVAAASEHACARDLRPLVQLRGELLPDATGLPFELLLTASVFVRGRRVIVAEASSHTPIEAWMRGEEAPVLPHPMIDVALLRAPLAELPWTCARATGEISGTARARLFDARPELDAMLELTDVAVRSLAEERSPPTLPYDARISVRTDGEGDAVELRACGTMLGAGLPPTPVGECDRSVLPQDGELIARATLPLTAADGEPLPQLDPTRESLLELLLADAHLEPLLVLVPGIAEADVLADGRAAARGSLDALRLEGGIALREGRMRLPSLGQHLDRMSGALQLEGDRIVLPATAPLRASDGDGEAEITGVIGMRGLIPDGAELSLRADRFPVRREGSVVATVTGSARTVARIGSEALEADVRLGELTVRLPEAALGGVQDLALRSDVLVIGEEAVEISESGGARYPYVLDIDTPTPFWVRRNDFAVQLALSGFHVEYDTQALDISGTAELARGYFEVFGKRFEVQTPSSLTFRPEASLDPIVDVTAVYELPGGQGATVSVSATGPLSALSVRFSSTEASDTGEILALLVGGRRALGGEEQQQVREAGSQAASFVAGLTAGILTLGLRQQFGDVVPVLAIETGDQLGATRTRVGFDANWIIPDFLREVVLGAYVEGFLTTAGQGGAGSGTGAAAPVGGGVSLELQFPFGWVGSGTYVPDTNFSIDFVWEP